MSAQTRSRFPLGPAALLLVLFPGALLAESQPAGIGISTDFSEVSDGAGCFDSSKESSGDSSDDSSGSSMAGRDALVGMASRSRIAARIAQTAGGEALAKSETTERAGSVVAAYLLLNRSPAARRVLTSGLSIEQIEALELDAADGGGPDIAVLAQGFNMAIGEVAEAVSAARSAVPESANREGFSEALITELAVRGRLTGEVARSTVDALHDEQVRCGCNGGAVLGSLSRASGIPVSEVGLIVTEVLDQRLADAALDGQIISAGELLTADADAVLEQILQQLVATHSLDVSAQIESLIQLADTHQG